MKSIKNTIKNLFSSCQSDTAVVRDTTSIIRQPRKKNKIKIEIPKSIFELDNPNIHCATPLNNQALFQELQNKVIQRIDSLIKTGDIDTKSKDSVHILLPHNKEASQDIKKVYDILGKINSQTVEILKDARDELTKKSKIPLECDNLLPLINLSAKDSNILHKDQGRSYQNSREYISDYAIVIPLLDYDLTGNGNHNFTPQSTQIIPHTFKHNIPEYNKQEDNRSVIFYNNLQSEDYKDYLVSDRLEQGTAIMLHTTTNPKSDNDGNSVIHKSPDAETGYARCFIRQSAYIKKG